MSDDLISRQAAIDLICKHGVDLERRGTLVLALVEHKSMTIDLLESLPTADVVEVVRCKECKFYDFWERKGIHLCVRWSGDPYEAAEPGEDDFCSFAERRDDAET